MATKYIYLDDERPQTVRPYIEEVRRHAPGLEISLHSPKAYPEQIAALRKDTFGGLILDLRLDQFVNWETGNGERADYRATTLAQEIRTRATEGNFVECPLVLWSTDKRLKQSYDRDDTAHDLFDLKCVKEEIDEEETAKEIAIRLVSLVSGYKEIAKIKAKHRRSKDQLYRFIGFKDEPDFVDPRILATFENKKGPIPVHEYARFLISELLELAGPLIDDRTLAARLGIDRDKSKDFKALKELHFREAQYRGPFNDGWPRWWAHLVEEKWRKLKGDPSALRPMPATQRVKVLRTALGLKGLISAPPIKKEYSESFWTVCRATGKPLDPRDGIIVQAKKLKPWHDKPYVSLQAALDGTMDDEGLKVDPIDRERLVRGRTTDSQ